jgi:hypothetical protein
VRALQSFANEDGGVMSEERDWKSEVESCEDAGGLYHLGLEMAAEIAGLQEQLNSAKQEISFALRDGAR